jgi:hypothetical protein
MQQMADETAICCITSLGSLSDAGEIGRRVFNRREQFFAAGSVLFEHHRSRSSSGLPLTDP